jgi:CDP-diacylglycerol--glycerol-3-phosphate 3-phosphatidyltransferase
VFNLPNLLTWLRIAAIPLLVLIYAWPNQAWSEHDRNTWAASIFVVAAITDALDGWLARRLGLTTPFGAFLDPVADKLMVCSALIVLLDMGRVGGLVALVIIGREITISALREWMANAGQRASVAVNWLGKAKTIMQLLAISLLLWNRPLPGGADAHTIGAWMIVLAAALTVISMGYYLYKAWPQIKQSA